MTLQRFPLSIHQVACLAWRCSAMAKHDLLQAIRDKTIPNMRTHYGDFFGSLNHTMPMHAIYPSRAMRSPTWCSPRASRRCALRAESTLHGHGRDPRRKIPKAFRSDSPTQEPTKALQSQSPEGSMHPTKIGNALVQTHRNPSSTRSTLAI